MDGCPDDCCPGDPRQAGCFLGDFRRDGCSQGGFHRGGFRRGDFHRDGCFQGGFRRGGYHQDGCFPGDFPPGDCSRVVLQGGFPGERRAFGRTDVGLDGFRGGSGAARRDALRAGRQDALEAARRDAPEAGRRAGFEAGQRGGMLPGGKPVWAVAGLRGVRFWNRSSGCVSPPRCCDWRQERSNDCLPRRRRRAFHRGRRPRA